ncbi:MAG: hypothetical protein K8I30_09050 [Anaerolineae bacterium]|nr:hypothetical protein [Anaerolineae bacterium]
MANTKILTVDADTKWLYGVGGICAIVLAVAYLITIPVYAAVGVTPSGGEAWLQYLDGKTALWWLILGLSILTDFLFVPVTLALIFALKGINRSLTLLGAAFVGLFVFLDLAVTWPNYAALISLGGSFPAATTEAQRAAMIAAAGYADAVLPYSLSVYSIIVLSFGILLIALVMLKGVFARSTAYVGLATGILGVVATLGSFFISALGTAIILTSVLTIIWLVLAGYRLYRLSREH